MSSDSVDVREEPLMFSLEDALEILKPGDAVRVVGKDILAQHPLARRRMGVGARVVSTQTLMGGPEGKEIRLEVELTRPYKDGGMTWTRAIVSASEWDIYTERGSDLAERARNHS